MMKVFLALLSLVVLASAAPLATDLETAIEWMERHPLIDGHNDLPYQFYVKLQNQIQRVDLTREQAIFQTDIPRLREGRVGGQFWSVYVGCTTDYTQWTNDVMRTLEQIDVTKRMIQTYPDDFQLALTAADIRAAFNQGKVASLMGIEGGHQIDSSLATIRMMHQLGVRYMTLTHNCHTPWADTHAQPAVHNGLTDFGKELVLEMNRMGIFVDLSHVSEKVMRDVLAISKAPIIFSHSSVYSICNSTRNVPDEVLALTAANGGVVMINYLTGFICCNTPSPCTISHVADHIEYIATRYGVDYIGLGADYDGGSSYPEGLDDVSTYPHLIAELVARGFTENDVAKIIGGNLLRAMEQMEAVARSLQQETLEDESFLITAKTCRDDDAE